MNMKHIKDIIRYGVETLHVTPEQLFSLIESSNGYDGEDYKRWLANQIIRLAEKEGMGYSQLLVKKFSIIQSLIEEYSDNSIDPWWVKFFKKHFSENKVYSFGIEGVGSEVEEEIDWTSGIDYDSINSEFVNEVLPEEIRDTLLENKGVTLFISLSSDSVDKKSDLVKESRENEVILKSEGGAILYRLASIVKAFDDEVSKLQCAFLCSTDFLLDEENQDAISYFLKYFTYNTKYSLVLGSDELFKDSYTSAEYAFILCKPREYDEDEQDGFVLRDILRKEDKLKVVNTRRFSRSNNSMLDLIRSKADVDSLEECEVPLQEVNRQFNSLTTGYIGCYGYLNVRGYSVIATSTPLNGYESIPITKKNFYDVICYYGLFKSLKTFGLSNSISEIATGSKRYKELLYNCLPILLYDSEFITTDVKIDGIKYHIQNEFDIDLGKVGVSKLLEEAETYFSTEAKEVVYICKGYLEYLKSTGDDVTGKTFNEVREDSNNEDLNKGYMSALVNLCDYISSLYRRIEY